MKAKIIKKIEQNPIPTALILVGSFVGFKLYQKFFKKSAREELKNVADEIKQLERTKDPNTGSTMRLTRTRAQWALVADSIYNSIKYSGISDNKANAEAQLKTVKNDLDLAVLIEQYGARQLYFFGLPDGDKMTLIAAIATGELNSRAIARINEDYKNKGITFRF